MKKAASQKTDSLNDTRTRILHVAAEVFAEFGFEKATVRVICEHASVNVAAINYHFRDKENLYIEVLKYCKALAFEKYPSDHGYEKNRSAGDKTKGLHQIICFSYP